MKIAYDSQIFKSQKYGGVSRYIVNLAQRVAREEQVIVLATLSFNHYLSQLPRNMVKGLRFTWRPPRGVRMLDWVGAAIERGIIAYEAPDLLHETYYSNTSMGPESMPKVVTVYDMIHERFPKNFSPDNDAARRKLAAVSRASHVICISENTRRDLLDLYEIDPGKVSVVHLGYDVLDAGEDSGRRSLAIGKLKPYLLYVGAREGYKNFKALLSAYAGSAWLSENFRVVCFGGGPLSKDELERARELSINPDQIEQVQGADDLLASYYQHAAAFVYPSLYEGFGIPLLEAMALGCPVVCSNTSSIPEVVGDAAECFDPAHVESIRAAIENVLQSSERRDELVRLGYRKCAEFSWDRCASETLKIYRGLVK